MAARYCQEETAEFVRRMDDWTAEIAAVLRGRTQGNYVATILIGGYGRGWGAMVSSDDGPMPVNDLDIALVTERRLPGDVVSALRHEATAVINPESAHALTELSELDLHVDVMNFTRGDLGCLIPTQFHVDLVESGRVVDGEDVLAAAKRISPADIDPGDALLAICNNSSSVYEPLAVGELGSRQTRVNLWMFATKAPIAASAAIGIVEKMYSPMPDERVRRVEQFLLSEPASRLRQECPAYAEMVQTAAMARAELTDERLAGTPEFFEGARQVMLNTMRHALMRIFGAPWIDDPAELGREAARLWRSELVFPPRMTLSKRLKGAAKSAMTRVGLRRPPAPWSSRARVYCASVPLLAAVRMLPDWSLAVDDRLARAARELLGVAGVEFAEGESGLDLWVETARAAVAALKRQNWNK